MKRKVLIIAVLILIIFATTYFVLHIVTKSRIPFFDTISYDTTCDEIIDLLGDPAAVEVNKDDTEYTVYTYQLVVLEEPASVEFSFYENELARVEIHWHLASEQKTNDMFALANQEIHNAFFWRMDFKTDEVETVTDSYGECRRQIYHLARPGTGREKYYAVSKTDSSVYITCRDFS